MLARASGSLLKPRYFVSPIWVAARSSQVRTYSSRDRRRPEIDYKIPSTADTPSWQQRTNVGQTPQTDQQREPLRPVSGAVRESVKAASQRSNATNDESPRERLSFAKSSTTSPSQNSAETRSSEADQQIPRSVEDPTPEETDTDEVLTEPQRPLPDLTKGIPSTLAAELERAQARDNQSASPSSLNITEDPSEPAGSERGRGGDGLPRSEYVSSSDQKKNTAFRYMYLVLVLGITGYTAYLGRNWENAEEEKKHIDAPSGWGIGLFYNRVKARLGSTMSYYNDPVTTTLLPDEEKDPNLRFPFTLVISLEDMLIHQEWTRERGWRIAKRPGVDYFLRYLSQYYEIVLFTSQPMAMADQVLRKLDPYSTIRWPLFREATLYKDGGYIKDLSYLNRDLKKVIIMDTDPHHVKNQPENAIILSKWKGDPKDQTLVQFIPFLEYLATMPLGDGRVVLKSFEGKYIPEEFAKREKHMREKFEAQEAEKRAKRPKRSVSGLGALFGVKQQSLDGMQTSDEAMAEGKMVWDQIRERGQRQYMEFEKRIQEEGAKWLAEREAEEKRYQEEAMKSMKTGFFGWFGGSGGGGAGGSESKPQ